MFLDAGDPGLHLRASLGRGEVGVGQPPAHPLRPAVTVTLQVPHVRPRRQKGSVHSLINPCRQKAFEVLKHFV